MKSKLALTLISLILISACTNQPVEVTALPATQTSAPPSATMLVPNQALEAPVEGVYFTAPSLDQMKRQDGVGGGIDDAYLRYRDEVIVPGLRELGFTVSPDEMKFFSWGEAGSFRWGFIPVNADGNMIWAYKGGQRALYPVYIDGVEGSGIFELAEGVEYRVIEGSKDATVIPGGSDGTLPIIVKGSVEIDGEKYFAMYHDPNTGEWELAPELEGKYEVVDGQVVEVDRASRWSYTAPDAEHVGQERYDLVMEFLSHPENIPTNEDIVRITMEDGTPLPFGEVMPETRQEYENGVVIGQYSFVLGGAYKSYEGVGYYDEDWYELLVFNPDNPDDFEAGGQILTISMKDHILDGNTVLVLIEPKGMREDRMEWVQSDGAAFQEPEMIKFFMEGLNGDRPLFGAQITFTIQLEPDGYSGPKGYIVGNSWDKNGDGLADNESGLLMIHGFYRVGIPTSSMTPELLEYMDQLDAVK